MANFGSVEIEIKVQIERNENFLTFLKEEARFTGTKHQIDTYYSPVHRTFTKVRPVKEWLRLRDSSGKYSINYKNWIFEADGKPYSCDEYESQIEDLEQLKSIFQVLNIKEIATVNKVRKTYIYNDYEISLDSIFGLGDFVEIEYKGKETNLDPIEVTNKMILFLKKFNCGKIYRNFVGYPFQLLFPDEVDIEEV